MSTIRPTHNPPLPTIQVQPFWLTQERRQSKLLELIKQKDFADSAIKMPFSDNLTTWHFVCLIWSDIWWFTRRRSRLEDEISERICFEKWLLPPYYHNYKTFLYTFL